MLKVPRRLALIVEASSPTSSIHPTRPASDAVAVIPVRSPATYAPDFCLTRKNHVTGIAAPVAVLAAVRDACTQMSLPVPVPFVMTVFHAGTVPAPTVYGIIQIAVPSIFTVPQSAAEIVIVPRLVEVV